MQRPSWLTADWLTHAILLLGVLVFVFPIYMTLIASTQDAGTIGSGNLSLLPGSHMIDNYRTAWLSGAASRVPAPCAR